MWTVKLRRFENGERIYLPFENDLPVFYPTYFVTRTLRTNPPDTQRNQLRELRLLPLWEADVGISIKDRIEQDKPLDELEMRSLVDFCGYSLSTLKKMRAGAKLLPKAYEPVSVEVKRNRLKVIKAYIEFLYRLLSKNPDKDDLAKRFGERFNSVIPKTKKHLNVKEEKSLNDEQLDVLLEKLMPDHPENPFGNNEALKYRNLLMLHVLYETGMRGGELLGLYVGDIDFQTGVVRVRRRHHDPRDPRRYQPHQKTRERDIPIPEGMLDMLLYYVMELRNRSKKSRTHPVLFVGHHNEHEGNALTKSGLQYVFLCIRKAFPVMRGTYPHLMRHHFNYRFSVMLQNQPGWKDMTPEERMKLDETTRSDIMGWNPEGKMQQLYNRRYNLEITNKALKERNDNLKGKVPPREDT
ncbi:MAG: site-specific integrase [Motiliproteus sp.]|nr:site-specific integrase [Motiliproteus sp.]MCW9050972.1 site-specific integrase [Motiliproteus sp.]